MALLVLQDGTMRALRMKTIVGRIWRSKYGDFQINLDYRYIYGKASIYFYYVKSPNPLDIFALCKIWEYLQTVKDPVLREIDMTTMITVGSAVGASTKVTMGEALGFDVVKFLELLKYTDLDAIEHLYDVPLRNDKPLPTSKDVSGIDPSPKYMGLYIHKDRKIDRVSLKIKRDGATVTGKCKFGDFDLSDRSLRYTIGKSSVWILVEGYKVPVNMNVSAYLNEFIPYEPLRINDDEENLSYADKLFKLATRPPPKKTMNVMLILIAIIGFVIVYQTVINPMVAKWQTDTAAKEAQDRRDQALNNGNGGNNTPPPQQPVIIPQPKDNEVPLVTES